MCIRDSTSAACTSTAGHECSRAPVQPARVRPAPAQPSTNAAGTSAAGHQRSRAPVQPARVQPAPAQPGT
eukprot:586324-Alexandrium_andersonii.AAC.1